MSTTIPTAAHHKALMSSALVVALLALALAVAGLVTSLGHTMTSPTTTVSQTSMAMADSSVKVRDGAVLPLETVTDADLTYVVPVSPTEYENLPTVHVQQGPAS